MFVSKLIVLQNWVKALLLSVTIKLFYVTSGKSPEAIRLLISIRKNTPITLSVLVTLRTAYYHETNIGMMIAVTEPYTKILFRS